MEKQSAKKLRNPDGFSNDATEAKRFWSLWRDGVNHDFLATFLRCRESCRLMFEEGWTAHVRWQALELQQGMRWSLWKARASGLRDPDEFAAKYRRLWLKSISHIPCEQMGKLEVVFQLLPVLLRATFERWPEDSKSVWSVVKPTVTAEWRYKDGKTTRLRARVAGVQEAKHGGLWLVDTYVGRALSAGRFEDQAFYNRRTIIGLFVLREVTGKQPAGVVYEVINRPVHGWPTNEGLADYLDHSAKCIKKYPDSYFQRERVSFSARKLNECLEQVLAPLMDDVRDWAGGKNRYPNVVGSPDDRYGYTHAPMYQAIVNGDFSGYYRRKRAFPAIAC